MLIQRVKFFYIMLLVLWLPLANAQPKQVVIYNWADYMPAELLARFTQETGIDVIYDTFDNNEILMTKMLSGKTGYDVVVPGGQFLVKMIEAGVLQPLDQQKIPNLKHTWDKTNQLLQQYPRANDYSVNWMWGTTGIAYNEAKINAIMPDAPLNSLAMIFDPNVVSKFANCGVYLLDAPDEVLPAVLLYLGLDPNSTQKNDLAQAELVLSKIRPYIKKFHSSEQINALANGDACLSLGWSGDMMMAKKRAQEANNNVVIHYVIPKEGAQIWFDQLAIPQDAPNLENAYQFINFMLDPENSAQASNFLSYASGNKAAQAFINADNLNNSQLYPSDQVFNTLFIKQPYDLRTQRTVTRIWTKIKSGQ